MTVRLAPTLVACLAVIGLGLALLLAVLTPTGAPAAPIAPTRTLPVVCTTDGACLLAEPAPHVVARS